MKLAIVGATGGTSHMHVEIALLQGYEVIALACNSETINSDTSCSVIQIHHVQ